MGVINLSGQLCELTKLDGYPISDAVSVEGVLLNPVPDELKLTLMSYNCGGYYLGSGTNVPTEYMPQFEQILRTIVSKNNCDVMCIQEHHHNFSGDVTAESILSDYYDSFFENGGNTQYGGRLTATRKAVSSNSYWSFSEQGGQGNCLEIVINVAGKDVHILSVHLDWQDQSRQELQAQELIQWASDKEYFVICGDLNSVCRGTQDLDYITVIKPFLDAGYNSANCSKFGFIPTFYKVGDNGDRSSLDQIITSSNIAIRRVWTDKTKYGNSDVGGSIDHLPLCAEIVIY